MKVRPPPASPQLPLGASSHDHLAIGRLRWPPSKEVPFKLFLHRAVLLVLFFFRESHPPWVWRKKSIEKSSEGQRGEVVV